MSIPNWRRSSGGTTGSASPTIISTFAAIAAIGASRRPFQCRMEAEAAADRRAAARQLERGDPALAIADRGGPGRIDPRLAGEQVERGAGARLQQPRRRHQLGM